MKGLVYTRGLPNHPPDTAGGPHLEGPAVPCLARLGRPSSPRAAPSPSCHTPQLWVLFILQFGAELFLLFGEWSPSSGSSSKTQGRKQRKRDVEPESPGEKREGLKAQAVEASCGTGRPDPGHTRSPALQGLRGTRWSRWVLRPCPSTPGSPKPQPALSLPQGQSLQESALANLQEDF